MCVYSELVDSTDWLVRPSVCGEAAVRLILLDRDIGSAQLALHDYESANRELNAEGDDYAPCTLQRMIHHGQTFVCAMWRAGRLLESLSDSKDLFPEPVAEAICLAWRSRRSMLDSYIEPRNAIEHIDGEVSGRTHWSMVNLISDGLQVADGKVAEISERNLQRLVDARQEIVKAVNTHLNDREPG